jgi:HAAS domain-containing protein
VISEYLERLARELAFDPVLARRMRREVEDHLREALESDPSDDRLDAERRAVSSFGSPRAIASQFAVVSLAALARRVGFAAVLLIGAVFIAMKARVAWYGVMPVPLADEMRTVGEIVLSIDRWAFWLALLAAAAGWVYIDSRRPPEGFTREYRTRLRRFSALCSAATVALAVCVAADAALTLLRLIGAQWSLGFVVPLFSMAIEVACAGALASWLHAMVRQASRAAHLSRAL